MQGLSEHLNLESIQNVCNNFQLEIEAQSGTRDQGFEMAAAGPQSKHLLLRNEKNELSRGLRTCKYTISRRKIVIYIASRNDYDLLWLDCQGLTSRLFGRISMEHRSASPLSAFRHESAPPSLPFLTLHFNGSQLPPLSARDS